MSVSSKLISLQCEAQRLRALLFRVGEIFSFFLAKWHRGAKSERHLNDHTDGSDELIIIQR